MREIIYKPGLKIQRFVLATDARRNTTNFSDDQIWEMAFNRGEPLGMALETSFGLRAKAFRIFPRFTYEDKTISDPSEFTSSLKIRPIAPGYIQFASQIFNSIEFTYHIWVNSSQSVCGIINFQNRSKVTRILKFELVAVLSPLSSAVSGGERMTATTLENKQILAGSTGNLFPFVYLVNGISSQSSPFPGLIRTVELAPGQSQIVQWIHAAGTTPEKSLEYLRAALFKQWEAELTRLEMEMNSTAEIITGNPDWNEAFDRANRTAFRLLQSPANGIKYPAFILSRQPDLGYSMRGDGSDYGPLWNGQSFLQAYYLASFMLPSAPNIAAGFLKNFLNTQREDGSIDFRISLAAQNSYAGLNSLLNATPLLAKLAWRIFEITNDRDLMAELLPYLNRFFESWFTPDRDRDNDGIPEWTSPIQTGLEDHPIYAHWLDDTPGLDITTVESPDLSSYLYSEAQALIKIAQIVENKEVIHSVKKRARILKSAVERSYVQKSGFYHTHDRETHLIGKTEKLGRIEGPGILSLKRKFPTPVRICISIRTADGTLRRPEVIIHGITTRTELPEESLTIENFRWRPGTGHATSQSIFSQIDFISIEGIGVSDEVTIATADHSIEDISGLIPLWAGIPDINKAKRIVKTAVLDPERFGKPYGLPASCLPSGTDSDQSYHMVQLPLNMLIIEGLIAYGLQEAATDLFSRLMQAVCENLEREGCFRRFYHADTGIGMGEADSLEGLPSTGLFLEILGVRFLSEHQVIISGRNSFPWPVTIKFKGMTIFRQNDRTTVIFPNGQTSLITDSRPHLVQIS